ncbi:YwdI family protein [Aquibacillus koreensis]|uniref:YwdI family protein n=1 Tax=Aquibacillus koreensis TaxID=279446 RepID=A0A9X3WJE9_9BACI|nr:YwdI family protein [Aquibacillus koreensis]MCT2538257.1 YwdI family protein [Aquibacillus koreensis]MDC3420800.1 YwdI family protein [Aquibacillus koreensis]
MAISDQTVLTKMMNELQEALNKSGQTNVVREHVRAVRLLCDLILDSEPESTGTTEPKPSIDQLELKKMMGNLGQSQPNTTPPTRKIDDEEANGDSIFDF